MRLLRANARGGMRRLVVFASLFASLVALATATDHVHHVDVAETGADQSVVQVQEHAEHVNSLRRLRARVSKLRARLKKNIVHRRNLERQRDQIEQSVEQKRSLIMHLRSDGLPRNGKEFRAAESQYQLLMARQGHLESGLNKLSAEAEQLVMAKNDVLERLQHINLEDLIERHAHGLPEPMLGALRKSALVLTPFFDTLFTAADTNSRLVNHVGAEIDKYTHVNIQGSPFLSGVLFYCVLLVPALTLAVCFRSIVDKSTKISASHFIVFGNIYFLVLCAILVCAAMLHSDPMRVLYSRYENFVILSNLVVAVFYVWYLVTLGVQTLQSWDNRHLAQFVAATAVGVHYFLFAWRRVFTDKVPKLHIFNYLTYATIFAFITYEHSFRINARCIFDNSLMRRFRGWDMKIDFSQVMNLFSKNTRRQLQLMQIRAAATLSSLLELMRPARWGWRRKRGRTPPSPAAPNTPRFSRASRSYAPVESSSESSSSGEDSDDSLESGTIDTTTAPISRTSASRNSLSHSRSSDEITERRLIVPEKPWWQRLWWYGVRAERSRSETEERALEAARERKERARNRAAAAWNGWQVAAASLFAGIPWFGASPVDKRKSGKTRHSSRRGKYERSSIRSRRDREQKSGFAQYWKWS